MIFKINKYINKIFIKFTSFVKSSSNCDKISITFFLSLKLTGDKIISLKNLLTNIAPIAIKNVVNILPSSVVGTILPYPTVVNVTIAQKNDSS